MWVEGRGRQLLPYCNRVVGWVRFIRTNFCWVNKTGEKKFSLKEPSTQDKRNKLQQHEMWARKLCRTFLVSRDTTWKHCDMLQEHRNIQSMHLNVEWKHCCTAHEFPSIVGVGFSDEKKTSKILPHSDEELEQKILYTHTHTHTTHPDGFSKWKTFFEAVDAVRLYM